MVQWSCSCSLCPYHGVRTVLKIQGWEMRLGYKAGSCGSEGCVSGHAQATLHRGILWGCVALGAHLQTK